MGPAALAARLGISIELAREYIKQYNETFSVLVAWLGKQREKALVRRAYTLKDYNAAENKNHIFHSLGYSETPSGRKRFYVIPNEPIEVKKASGYMWVKELGKKVWVNDSIASRLPYDPADTWSKELKRLADKGDITAKRIKTYYSKMASIQREAGNAPIQGTNADMTKIAMYLFRKFIRQYEKDHNNGMYIGHIALQVYDELLVIAREDVAEMFGDKLTECMIEAGNRFITEVPVEAACVVADTWVH